jgi:hypothetical protein
MVCQNLKRHDRLGKQVSEVKGGLFYLHYLFRLFSHVSDFDLPSLDVLPLLVDILRDIEFGRIFDGTQGLFENGCLILEAEAVYITVVIGERES